ncbi:hypothetical protein [Arthrobacter oryzae]|nr:hypothetical protein [Arthrobacter oryzae]
MNNASEPSFQEPSMQVPPARGAGQGGAGQHGAGGRARVRGQALPAGGPPVAGSGVLKAMSPGVVDFLFRKLVAGESAEDFQWHTEGVALAEQPPGAELARRLAGTDLDALTPTELFHYVRAVQRLAAWAEALREEAVGRYCSPGQGEAACPP